MKAVLFDLGRVLIHYDHAQTVAGTASVCQATPDEVRALLDSMLKGLETGSINSEILHCRLRADAGATPDYDVFFAAVTSGMARDEGALAFAIELERRPDVLVGVISNTTEIHVRWLDAQISELRDFDLVMMSNEIGLRKPDPAVFRLALELLDIQPQAALFVDDLAENVEGARSVGLAGIVHQEWSQTRPAIEEWLAQ